MPPAKPLAITSGEPAGIGAEIIAAALAQLLQQGHAPQNFCVLGDCDLLNRAAHVVHAPQIFEHVPVAHHAVAMPVTYGQPDSRNAAYVLNMLDQALTGCLRGEYSAMVTAPIHKASINDAGIPFSGHTEYLAHKTQTSKVVMLLTAEELTPPLRVALATTHLPLRDVSDALSVNGLVETLHVLNHGLQQWFGISAPQIKVCGLNPHAGEGGHLGSEDAAIIAPAIEIARQRGINASGPWPADTVFNPHSAAPADAILAMYHDQGLPVLKYASFGKGVNVTLGLPFIRTSVDHGTALDLAGQGKADCASLVAAIELALRLAKT